MLTPLLNRPPSDSSTMLSTMIKAVKISQETR